ncbi:nicotinamide-nucleotide amidohydrolase family protein [Streptomyces sp. p1417]|uniref:Nicotinamide-nucleotide amidohydrolase family protein n=1 Tax=Streptomyces typhae TaxID=2681492 RepID=A0A6L6X7E3_9ACTN|nr:CinA family protein [Streptomyces typhae]MVO89661.1 nicotinamide-nucleotide amidohydrolase family protein [Streptomyces typhae]
MLAKSAVEVLRLLVERGETLAVAESLTGGLVAAEVTSAPGASRAFKGSVTSYATEVKRDLLGVDADLLAERGAVDGEVALQMARGVRALLGADWGVATTGVAGPERQDGQPVGTVFVAVAGPGGSDRPETDGCLESGSGSALRSEGKVAALRLNGNRTEIRMESVRSVLELLLDQLSGERTGNGRAQDTEQNGGT